MRSLPLKCTSLAKAMILDPFWSLLPVVGGGGGGLYITGYRVIGRLYITGYRVIVVHITNYTRTTIIIIFIISM